MFHHTTSEDAANTRIIHVNPNFTNVTMHFKDAIKANAMPKTMQTLPHINPLFLQAGPLDGILRYKQQKGTSIYMNPAFLQKKLVEQRLMENIALQQVDAQEQKQRHNDEMPSKIKSIVKPEVSTEPITDSDSVCKVIIKSRMCIVREPATKSITNPTVHKNIAAPRMVSISKRKLVRRNPAVLPINSVLGCMATKSAVIKPATVNGTKSHSIGKYKLDNRCVRTLTISNASSLVKVRRSSFVARYALRRGAAADGQLITSKGISDKSGTKRAFIYKPNSARCLNKKLQLLNINGVLYKSSRNKLQRKDDTPRTRTRKSEGSQTSAHNIGTLTKTLQPHKERAVFVHGTKFVMDAAGFKLTRVPAPKTVDNRVRAPQRQRIDIGGLTYVASKTQNEFLCTRYHLARAHLNSAKQRSLQVLSKSLVKSNIPCAIFQRLGKCMAFERGKCSKVHDKNQVVICHRFLRGECLNPTCLLSHNISLAKMPVCKFFLEGVCVRVNCKYLHKKLSPTADICKDFLAGFCKLAEQCNKRHEFLCPNFERTGKCGIKNCIHCKNKKRQQLLLEQAQQQQQQQKQKQNDAKIATSFQSEHNYGTHQQQQQQRYFVNKCEEITAAPVIAINPTNASDNDTSYESTEPARVTVASGRPVIGVLPAYIPFT